MTEIYTDASYDHLTEKAGWAYVIVRNGNVIDKGSGCKLGIESIDDAEAFAILMAVFAYLLTLTDGKVLVVWCDNLSVVHKLQRQDQDYNEVIKFLKSKSGHYCINYIPRRSNNYSRIVDENSKKARKNES